MPTAETTPSNPLYTRLHELEQETDLEFVIELIDIYIDETPKQIQAIDAALTSHVFPSLTITAHTLKGSSLNLGAKQLGALCQKLEEMGRAGKCFPESNCIAEIEKEFENVKTILLEFKESKKTAKH
jgi:histidine phosphotransfer protein HptB